MIARKSPSAGGSKSLQAAAATRCRWAHPGVPHAGAIADLHRRATADPLSVDHDIDRLVVQRPLRQQGRSARAASPCDRKFQAPDLERNMQRPVVSRGRGRQHQYGTLFFSTETRLCAGRLTLHAAWVAPWARQIRRRAAKAYQDKRLSRLTPEMPAQAQPGGPVEEADRVRRRACRMHYIARRAAPALSAS